MSDLLLFVLKVLALSVLVAIVLLAALPLMLIGLPFGMAMLVRGSHGPVR